MKPWLLLFCIFIGCKKAENTTPAAATVNSAIPAVSTKASAPNLEGNTGADATGPMLKKLTQAVRRYGIEQRRVPANLDEVFAQGYLKELPQPPAGKRFFIDKKLEVTLINR